MAPSGSLVSLSDDDLRWPIPANPSILKTKHIGQEIKGKSLFQVWKLNWLQHRLLMSGTIMKMPN